MALPVGSRSTGAHPLGAVPRGAFPRGAFPWGVFPWGASPVRALRVWAILSWMTVFCLAPPIAGAQPNAARSRIVVASDGVRLHVQDSGPPGAHVILLVPGWTMPAWIWEPQIRFFSRNYRVLAFDPRGQGASDVPATGYDHIRRGKDIGDVIAQLAPSPPVVVAWSLGVLDTLAYLTIQGDARVAGLVLVDNSVGEEPAPIPARPKPTTAPKPPHEQAMRQFVRGMFRQPQSPAYLERLTQATLRTPEPAAKALLSYPVPRGFWRDAVYATRHPVLYVVRPRWAEQAQNLARNRAGTETDIFYEAGHALFVDEPARFNRLVEGFIRRRVWP